MWHDIVLAPEAAHEPRRLTANIRSDVRDAIEKHLRHQPGKTSKGRIKRLRGVSRPQFRLRVGDARIFYDVSGRTVEVLAIVLKSGAEVWLKEAGEKT